MGGLDLGKRLAHGGGAGKVEGDGEEKAALKKEQLEESAAPRPPQREGHDVWIIRSLKSRNLYREAASFKTPRVSTTPPSQGVGVAKAEQQDSPTRPVAFTSYSLSTSATGQKPDRFPRRSPGQAAMFQLSDENRQKRKAAAERQPSASWRLQMQLAQITVKYFVIYVKYIVLYDIYCDIC